jgi:hypothetical protein
MRTFRAWMMRLIGMLKPREAEADFAAELESTLPCTLKIVFATVSVLTKRGERR